MKLHYFFASVLAILLICSLSVPAQSSLWYCDYATYDDSNNGAGYPVIAVGVIKENTFVALMYRESPSSNYLVGYSNADSAKGRMGSYGYGGDMADYYTGWTSGFDLVNLTNAFDLATTEDSLVYVANNDDGKNILVFKMSEDSVISTDYRMSTGSDDLWAIDVDMNGYVYVTRTGDSTNAGSIIIYKGINDDGAWLGMHDSQPIQTITVPDAGSLRGITVNKEGTIIYVSNYLSKKIYCYIGSPETGYTLEPAFNFTLTDQPLASDGTQLDPGPWGLRYMEGNNLLFVACDVPFMRGVGYEYGRVYMLNPNSGEILDTIDCAKWNFDMTGSYSTRDGGTTPGNVSGYTATYGLDVDANNALYLTAYWGWSIDKWTYQGTLPSIEITVDVEKEDNFAPSQFSLAQNYPNPFNPVTKINFSIPQTEEVTLKVYDLLGNEVATLINGEYSAGNYKVTFDGSNLSSGVYFYTLKAGSISATKKLVLMK